MLEVGRKLVLIYLFSHRLMVNIFLQHYSLANRMLFDSFYLFQSLDTVAMLGHQLVRKYNASWAESRTLVSHMTDGDAYHYTTKE